MAFDDASLLRLREHLDWIPGNEFSEGNDDAVWPAVIHADGVAFPAFLGGDDLSFVQQRRRLATGRAGSVDQPEGKDGDPQQKRPGIPCENLFIGKLSDRRQ
jgi:hypothetical protein